MGFLMAAVCSTLGVLPPVCVDDPNDPTAELPSFQGPKAPGQKMASIGGRFGLWNMKDADGSVIFTEMHLDIPVSGDFYSEFRLGAAGEDETGLVNIYFALGTAYDLRIGKTKLGNSDVEFAFRPSVSFLYSIHNADTGAEANYDALRAGVTDVEVSVENAFGFTVAGQLIMTSGRTDISLFLGYSILDASGEGSALPPTGPPVRVSETVDLSGFLIGFGIGYRF